MRLRVLPLALLCAAVLAAPAQAAPVIVSVGVDGVPTLGETVTIDVSARDPQRSVIGFATDGVAESACRVRRTGKDDESGPFASGRTVTAGLPYVATAPGIQLVDVTVRSGGCSGAEEETVQALAITVVLPNVAARLWGYRSSGCANADTMPTGTNGASIRAATLCLVNEIRQQRGLRPLREDTRLRKAAVRHSKDMVARHFLDHEGPGGPGVARRFGRVDYWPADVSENIGTGGATAATPAGMVELWMDSDIHRANLLAGRFKGVGIGIAPRETDGSSGATYTVDFGGRTPR